MPIKRSRYAGPPRLHRRFHRKSSTADNNLLAEGNRHFKMNMIYDSSRTHTLPGIDALQIFFADYDTAGDGLIDFARLKAALTRAGKELCDDDCAKFDGNAAGEEGELKAAEYASSEGSGTARETLPPGTCVVISGLVSRPDLNGKQGHIVQLNEGTGRYSVRLVGGKELSLKRECVNRNLVAEKQTLTDAELLKQAEKPLARGQATEARGDAAATISFEQFKDMFLRATFVWEKPVPYRMVPAPAAFTARPFAPDCYAAALESPEDANAAWQERWPDLAPTEKCSCSIL